MDRSCLSYYFSILKNKIGKNWIAAVNSVEIPENFLKIDKPKDKYSI